LSPFNPALLSDSIAVTDDRRAAQITLMNVLI